MESTEFIVTMLGSFAIAIVISLVILIGTYAILGQVFKKAGLAWWKAFIPFYNNAMLFKIVGMNPLWVILCFIPIINVAFAIASLVCVYRLSKKFGLSTVVAVIGIFFPIVPYCIIAFVPYIEYLGEEWS